jgi:DNA-binding NtrC family response regulator
LKAFGLASTDLPPLTIALLNLCRPHADTSTFCAKVRQLSAQFPSEAITRRLEQLVETGLTHDHGSPASGWLTLKGERLLYELPTDVVPMEPVAVVAAPAERVEAPTTVAVSDDTLPIAIPLKAFNSLVHREYWRGILTLTRGNVSHAAQRAGCTRESAYRHMRSLGIDTRAFRPAGVSPNRLGLQ